MNRIRVLALCLMVTTLLAACGDRNSGFSPAENAVTANPEDTIDLRARDYELPEATPAPEGPTASYDTGDSSGGRTLTLSTLNPALAQAARGTEGALEDAVAENELVDGRSTTIADEISEGDAAEVTGGEQNIVTDTADTITDTVVEPEAAEPTDEATDENTTAETSDGAGVTSSDTETAAAAGATSNSPTTSASETNAATDETAADASTAENTEASQPADAVSAQASSFEWQELGATTYNGNCAACHQQNGQGIPGAFPPLAGHINELYTAEGGRKYLVNLVLYGLQGELEVLGQTYNGVMPPWSQLSNDQIAATLNHALSDWGNDALLTDFTPILPEEVEAERGNDSSAAQVLELRPDLP